MLGFSRFCKLLFSISLLIGCQSQLALSQGFSRLEPELTSPQSPVRPTLRTGSQGNAVSELQAALKLLGYYTGAVDGNFSESTAIAVSQFQQAAGLRVDGVVGPSTWEKLFPLTPPTPPSRTSRTTDSTSTELTNNQPTATSNNPTATPSPNNQPTATSNNPTATPSPNNQPTTNSNPTVAATLESSSQNLPTLRLGVRGPEVFWLQKRLQTAGFFRGSVDGIFGPGTEDAVKAAQTRYGLRADGIVGPSTWRALLR